jgi:hypothetical protein
VATQTSGEDFSAKRVAAQTSDEDLVNYRLAAQTSAKEISANWFNITDFRSPLVAKRADFSKVTNKNNEFDTDQFNP